MTTNNPSARQLHAPGDVNFFMRQVLLAMIPGVLVLFYFFGWQILFNIALAMGVALAAEAWMLWWRKKRVQFFLRDCTALITAALLAVSLPASVPWWGIVVGAVFAIIIVKHLYGGLGQNIFNPAMAGYALLLIAFPMQMTTWPAPAGVADVIPVDAVSMATPLDTLKSELRLGYIVSEVMPSLSWGPWQWMNLAWLVGGIYLLAKRIIRWYIPAGVLGGLFVVATLFYFISPDQFASPVFHLFTGATMIGAFFIATDPVSAATSPTGQIIYGAGVGILLYVIRVFGGYPDGVAFAVLLMNLAVPTIDYYTKPRVYGHRDGHRDGQST